MACATRTCEATESNPGGTNNYIPDAPERASLGSGFVITGQVRAVNGCTPLEGVRVQVWLATETGGEQDNRVSIRTGPDGGIGSRPIRPIPQFSPTARSTAPVPWSCSRSWRSGCSACRRPIRRARLRR